MAIVFKVHGPYPVPVTIEKGGKQLPDKFAKSFWGQCQALRAAKGCYVFAMKAGKGSTPWYVGKATKGFEQEVFTGHKLAKYFQAMNGSGKGTPQLYFIAYPVHPGKPGTGMIRSLELQLIGLAEEKNSRLLNVHGKRKQPTYRVAGLLHRGKGKPSRAAQDLRGCLGL